MTRSAVFLLATSLIGLGALPARAQIDSREGIALQNQILELRQELQALQQAMGNGVQASPPPAQPEGSNPPPASAVSDVTAQLVVRVSALEEQMRTLQGRVDELTEQEKRDHDDVAKQIGDLAFKLGQGGPSASGIPGQPGVPGDVQSVPVMPPPGGMDLSTPAPKPHPPAPHRTPELALKQGSAALARRDYAAAEAAAQEVLALGHGPRTGDAQYLLARAQAGQHDYQAAAASFYEVYKANPRSLRAAESLLGVSNSLLGLGDKSDACQAVAKLSAEFPHLEPGLRAGAASVRKRAACH